MSFGTGQYNLFLENKIKYKNSTISELVATDNALILILWTKLFMEAQGYGMKNIYIKQ